jgi:hypothetical protein
MVPGFGAPVDPDMCPFACASFGDGFVGFFGDVNSEAATWRTLLQVIGKKLHR